MNLRRLPEAAPRDTQAIEISHSIEIARSRDAVHRYVSDPRNDPAWCRKVRSVDALDEGAGVFEVVHRPIPFRPARTMRYERLETAPDRLRWREDDGTDRMHVTYELEDVAPGRTRFTQRTAADIGAPRLLRPVIRAGIARDIRGQLRRLRDALEADGATPE